MKRLIAETERGCDELLVASAEKDPHVPLPPTAVKRLEKLREGR